jgi:hypothetical protein
MRAEDYEQMAAQLRAAATQYPLWCEENTTERATFNLMGNFRVSCLPSQPAINALASRLQKGPTKYQRHRSKQRQG